MSLQSFFDIEKAIRYLEIFLSLEKVRQRVGQKSTGLTSEVEVFFWEVWCNHLGNVLATISDKVIAIDEDNNGTVDYFQADILTTSDYYPFGLAMKERKFGSDDYRYGFNGKENDKDFGNKQIVQDYGFRIYNPSTGRFLSVDPLTQSYPWYTPYQFAGNKPIENIDLDGLEEFSTKENTTSLSQMTLDGYTAASSSTSINQNVPFTEYQEIVMLVGENNTSLSLEEAAKNMRKQELAAQGLVEYNGEIYRQGSLKQDNSDFLLLSGIGIGRSLLGLNSATRQAMLKGGGINFGAQYGFQLGRHTLKEHEFSLDVALNALYDVDAVDVLTATLSPATRASFSPSSWGTFYNGTTIGTINATNDYTANTGFKSFFLGTKDASDVGVELLVNFSAAGLGAGLDSYSRTPLAPGYEMSGRNAFLKDGVTPFIQGTAPGVKTFAKDDELRYEFNQQIVKPIQKNFPLNR